MSTPGLHHIVLTVSNVSQSRAFYHDLLGFEVIDMQGIPGGGFFFNTGGISIFVFASRELTPGDRFSEFRIGLDHLAFTASDKETLQAIADKLLSAGVNTKEIEQFAPTGNLYIAFRDPDNIQLEYWLP